MKKLKTILLIIIGLAAVSVASINVYWQTAQQPTAVKEGFKKSTTISSNSVQLASDIDPVCNMPVNHDYADTTLYEGKIYGFCSAMCKESFNRSHRKATK